MTSRASAWLIALGGTAAVTAAGRAMGLNASTAGFAFLIVVLLSSLRGGLLVGTFASVLATLCYNFFFFPPLYTFVIHDASNWVALAAFLVTAVVVGRLVTERERILAENAHIEALRESETLKTSLLRAISHDLTTPLTAITIHTETLRRKAGGDGELRTAVTGIADETERLRRRISNLLAMARLEAGKARPHPEPTPPADLLRAVRENLPLVFQHRTVTVRVADDCPDAHVDPSLALEILVNLIENAHRAAPADTLLDLVARKRDPARVCIDVLDRGPGLPEGVGDAQGLGLQIARSLALANDGSVTLAPREGGGTVATLDLPAALLPLQAPV
jgi:two-component system, OmpR family, sensor histidine kinase KdpD